MARTDPPPAQRIVSRGTQFAGDGDASLVSQPSKPGPPLVRKTATISSQAHLTAHRSAKHLAGLSMATQLLIKFSAVPCARCSRAHYSVRLDAAQTRYGGRGHF